MSRSASSYKDMREQLRENLQRICELECVASGATPSPPSPPSGWPSSTPKGTASFLEALGFQGDLTHSLESAHFDLAVDEAADALARRRAEDGI
ncbi:unnamed protein product [Polarella glacialis]|uniref:Uncharacterized protein n=1 Tax=Polarella glacialis TaxID=89957 RepID=A0A813JF17_POLGL|nr:unnamed protein product [Polarella glacialis]